jgi:SAM-dependent methyltransferase
MKVIVINAVKSIYGWIYQIVLPILVYPPGRVYEGQYYTIHRLNIIQFLESWQNRIHGKVLNVGAGTWGLPRELFAARCEYVATDSTLNPNIDIISDIHRLTETFEPGSFDFVICTDVLEHVQKPWIAIRQLFEVLKPGGFLLLTTPFNFYLHGNQSVRDYWRVSSDGLTYLLKEEAQFRQVEIDAVGHRLFPFSHLVTAQK